MATTSHLTADRLQSLRHHTTQARAAADVGDTTTARAILGAVLTPAHTTHPDPDVADAATLLAHLLLTDAGLHVAARTWVAYAHNTYLHVHGSIDERTITAVLVYARVHRAAGDIDAAENLYSEAATALATTVGPTAVRTITVRAELAEMRHQDNLCPSALDLMGTLYTLRSDHHGNSDPLAITLLACLGGMYRDCGHHTHAEQATRYATTLATAAGGDLITTVATIYDQHDPSHPALCAYTQCPPQPIPDVPTPTQT